MNSVETIKEVENLPMEESIIPRMDEPGPKYRQKKKPALRLNLGSINGINGEKHSNLQTVNDDGLKLPEMILKGEGEPLTDAEKRTIKLYDTSKSLFSRLSEDPADDDRAVCAQKLQCFLDVVLPGDQQKPFVALSRLLGLLPPYVNELGQIGRLERLEKQSLNFGRSTSQSKNKVLKRQCSVDIEDEPCTSYAKIFEDGGTIPEEVNNEEEVDDAK